MAKPVKPKDLKPKTSEPEPAAPAASSPGGSTEAAGTAAKPVSGGGGALDLKFIITLVVILVSTTVTSVAAAYFVAPMVLVPAIIAKLPHATGEGTDPAAEGGEAAKDGEEAKKPEGPKLGQNLDLEEFTANLKDDPELGGTQYVRTKMALSIGVPKEEDCAALKEAKEKEAKAKDPKAAAAPPPKEGEGGGGKEAPEPCLTEFTANMAPYTPTIRDIINSTLMAHSADELASPKGQEKFKDELKKQITTAMAPKYSVMRVNFQDFIIQK